MSVRVLILNDTRREGVLRPPGGETAMTNLLALCRAHGLEVVRTLTRPDAVDTDEFQQLLPQVDSVLVNGEGTMQHDSADAVALARGIVTAKLAGKHTALVNAVWQGNDLVNECLAALDFLCVRDPQSANEVRAAGREDVVLAPDFSLWNGRKSGGGILSPDQMGNAARTEASADEASKSIERAFATMAERLGANPVGRCDVLREPPRRTVRVCYFNTWARGVEEATAFGVRAPAMDLTSMVSNPRDAALMKKARLDSDWYAENARCFAAMENEAIRFLPALTCGPTGLVEFTGVPREPGEERWLITMAHQPQALGAAAAKAFELLSKMGVRHLFYAFDEASRMMPCFSEIAPHLDVLIHDESPLDPKALAQLKPGCLVIHRSWVANLVPFAVPFNDAPEEKILFLGSQLGLTPHRLRQIEFLKKRFKDRFVAYHDHSVAVADRGKLNRFKVSVCPEGRKFTTLPMAKTHTDRPFWSGCLGLVPVSENSKTGNRLQELHEQSLIFRYEHGDLDSLAAQCERALAMLNAERRRIYDYFNRHETVGTVVAEAIGSAHG